MATSPPRRRFLPEPIETSARTSKTPRREEHILSARSNPEVLNDSSRGPPSSGIQTHTSGKPRHFLPQPVEESSRSSRRSKAKPVENASVTHDDQASGHLEATVGEEQDGSTPLPAPRRRFAPEPVETTSRSSRKKFSSQPIETSSRNSRDRKRREGIDTFSAPKSKFPPEPIETSSTRRRRAVSHEDDSSSSPSPTRTSSSGSPRRFIPELLETAKGSYRRSLVSTAQTTPTGSTKSSPPNSNLAAEIVDAVPDIHESRFSAANLAKRQDVLQRQRSFQVPDLPIIESDDSDVNSEPPSLSGSPTDSSASLDRHQTRELQTAPGSYAHYLFNLAAKATERELREQAMAAYINERPHEPVDHFAMDEDDDDDGRIYVGKFTGHNGASIRTFRRDSAEDLKLELQDIRRHHELLEAAKRDLKENTAGQSRFSSAALLARQKHGLGAKPRKRDSTRTRIRKAMQADGGRARDPTEDNELTKMRNAASPPMQGGDLIFPFTTSPKMTRCETDQAPRPRTADGPDSEAGTTIVGEPGLWCAQVNVSTGGSAGLWMGMCKRDSHEQSRPVTPLRSGIQTPAYDIHNPFDAPTPSIGGRATPGKRAGRPYLGMQLLPMTPPRDNNVEDAFVSSIDRKLLLERQIDEQFPNHVITQIYNYLSLGYPSLARPFDEELSKISKISIEEIRRDDETQDAKGYVGAPEGHGVDGTFIENEGGCRRWEALRLYVREWARQSPNFKTEAFGVGAAWGARARRGSWAH